MIRILMGLSFVLSSNLLMANTMSLSGSNLTPCFNMTEVERIGKQLNEILKDEFCEEKVDPRRFAAISQKILPKIMNKSFLGVAPPDNWQQLTDNIIKNCLQKNDLCKKKPGKSLKSVSHLDFL